ncbi:hydrolase [Rhodococcus sp. 05-340-1]|uniref:C40 family peptidase n=1 Tax=unclassified Rhodococcus (in: high G+C Gram-positive bacteria) TaxID=192944 RepID=UPI000B9AC83D|nr:MULTISPECIES: C40 family peptidase [unclassified Rhodococcus (in: high G+C Gram-positive bacteria)]OZD68752.1 hydrolase [Rhodococcus sp. 05-340-2]OZD70331.1 hydrolase [Rhodococcus sp. 05-340-1]
MIDLLARPIVDLLGAFGNGELPTGGPADVLRVSSAAIEAAQGIGRVAITELAANWNGDAADAAIRYAENAHRSAIALADHADDIAAVVDQACRDATRGFLELQSIVRSFVGIALSAGPIIATPAGQTMLITAAIEHLERALVVVARVRGELAVHSARVGELAAPPTVPAPVGGGPTPTPGSPSNLMTSPATSQVIEAGEKLAKTFAQSVSSHAAGAESPSIGGAQNYLGNPGADPSPTPDSTGRGVEIRLPDGSTVTAPNAEAAGAVRSALTQQGVPYAWGGTTPGSGLDCSGLTQWAYAQQGVEIPRLAQEQDIGSAVAPGEVMPGDLAVWDGHVAMVIGNGQLVEAGDPVQVGPIRTTNSGMGFKGFYRPTE